MTFLACIFNDTCKVLPHICNQTKSILTIILILGFVEWQKKLSKNIIHTWAAFSSIWFNQMSPIMFLQNDLRSSWQKGSTNLNFKLSTACNNFFLRGKHKRYLKDLGGTFDIESLSISLTTSSFFKKNNVPLETFTGIRMRRATTATGTKIFKL